MDKLRKHQVSICKDCENKLPNMKKGLTCSLTGDLPTFTESCPDFKRIDESFKLPENRVHDGINKELSFEERKQRSREIQKEYERKLEVKKIIADRHPKKKTIVNSAGWFYFIGTFSIINSLLHYIGVNFRFNLGLGLSTIIEVMASTLNINWLGAIFSISLALLYLYIGNHARLLEKWAFKTGLIIYIIDTLIVLFVVDWINLVFHILALFFMIRGYKAIGETIDEKGKTTHNIL